METVTVATQIDSDSDDVDDDDDVMTQKNANSSSSEIRVRPSTSPPRCQSATGLGMSARVPTESHFHQNECSARHSLASDGQNIYCRCVINNVGTGARFRLRELALSRPQRRKIYRRIVRGAPTGLGQTDREMWIHTDSQCAA